jgi:thioredoxin-like negative regulator of GroEL
MAQETTPNNKLQNIIVALIAVSLAVALFFGQRSQLGGASLSAQAAAATQIETALTNKQPTLMEFYADWYASCRAMAPGLAQLKKDFAGKVNFAMLNVDNTKWLPEIEKYRVDGIPHFVFFDGQGQTLGEVIGEQPTSIMSSTLDRILTNQIKPSNGQTIKQSSGQTSPMSEPSSTSTDPRSHGAQVKAS